MCRLTPTGSMAVLLIAAVLVVTLAACSSDPPAPGTTDTAVEDTVTGVDTTPPPDTKTPKDTAPEVIEDTTPPPPDTAEDTSADTTPDIEEIVEDTFVPLPDCDPPLSVDADNVYVLPYSLMTFGVSGGTGQPRFELTDAPSGGIINPETGAYLSGDVSDVTDVLKITDVGCQGEATVTIQAVPHMNVLPDSATVPPNVGFKMLITGGSGFYQYTLAVNNSAGAIDTNGLYGSGIQEGTDRIEVTDTGTGETVKVEVVVAVGSELKAVPSHAYLPVGATYKLEMEGGSGIFTAEVTGPGVFFENGTVTAVTSGSASLTLTDSFTGEQTEMTVTSVPSQQVAFERTGFGSATMIAEAPGDINGDGYPDAVFALAESAVNGYYGGAVYVYAGTAEGGLSAEPVRVFGGTERVGQMGRSMEIADFWGNDGKVDIAIGVPYSDTGAVNAGAVIIYKGIDGGFFSEQPVSILSGPWASDLFGWTMDSCDFNGDGKLDLVVGALYGEDRDASPIIGDTGTVHIFFSYPDGFLPEANVKIHGGMPDGAGGYTPTKSIQFTRYLRAGYMDGDQYCDLAVAAYVNNGNTGMVQVFKGIPSSSTSPGGVQKTPSRVIVADAVQDTNGQMGRRIAVGDLTGDGKAELIIGHWVHDAPKDEQPVFEGCSETCVSNCTDDCAALCSADCVKHCKKGCIKDRGAVWVIKGGELSDTPATSLELISDAADWVVKGSAQSKQNGWGVKVADTNGDGIGDLIGGHWNDCGTVCGSPGAVKVYYGKQDELPDTTPDLVIAGETNGDRFGEDVAVYKNATANTPADFVVAAGLGDYIGYLVGQPYLVRGGAEPTLTLLTMPSLSSGSYFGTSAAVVGDVTGNGYNDLLVGAPLDEPPEALMAQTGAVYLYQGGANGFVSQPSQLMVKHQGHSGWDYHGWRVEGAGDFNGDNIPDFAIAGRYEDKPGNLNSPYPNHVKSGDADSIANCEGVRNNSGAVYIYLGSNSGLPSTQPAFVYFGEKAAYRIDDIASNFDINGDGYTDLIVSTPATVSTFYNGTDQTNAGSISIALGRPANAQGITVICDTALSLQGVMVNDYFGRSVTRLGDINGDKCDEIVIGIQGEDLALSNQGTFRVIYGWGPKCSYQEPRVALFRSGLNGAYAGYAVDGGLDVDGDNIPDLAVGAYNYTVAGTAVGAAWVIPGSYILSKGNEKLVDGHLPVAPTASFPFLDNSVSGQHRVDGTVGTGQFGWSVALVPKISGGGRAGLIVSEKRGSPGGTELAGGAYIYRYSIDPANYGLVQKPAAAFGGESYRPAGEFGDWVSAGTLNGDPVILVGGYFGTAKGHKGIDQGSLYVANLKALLSP